MSEKHLTDTELLILGLVAEMPRHGYELEQVIEQRGMREWTQIGFSSIYYVLGKLENKGLMVAEKPINTKAKKKYVITKEGQEALIKQTLASLKSVRSNFSSALLGMIHWSVLTKKQSLDALQIRGKKVDKELERIEQIHFEQQPLPDHVDAMFDFSINQLKAESEWISKTLAYMQTKIWDE